jgi:hypothetical protein
MAPTRVVTTGRFAFPLEGRELQPKSGIFDRYSGHLKPVLRFCPARRDIFLLERRDEQKTRKAAADELWIAVLRGPPAG